MQVFALGLLGELIIFTHAREMKDYRVEEIIQYPDQYPGTVASSVEVTDVEPGEGRNREIRHTDHGNYGLSIRRRACGASPTGCPVAMVSFTSFNSPAGN